MQQSLSQLIVFLEISPLPIAQLIKDVESLCNFNYPYEYHLTLGWFTDEKLETLRKLGNLSVNYVKDKICKLDANFLSREDSLFNIIITGAARQPMSRGGGFYLQPSEQDIQRFGQIHQELSSFMNQNQVRTSELISNYHPHVSLTTPIPQETFTTDQEAMILKILNNKIANLQGNMPGMLMLQPIAVRTILKYTDPYGSEQREIWDTTNSEKKTAINFARNSGVASSLLESN